MTSIKRTIAPPPRVVIADNSDYFYTESIFPARCTASELWDFLKENTTTGELYVQWSQGGINEIRLREKTRLPSDKANEIRKIMEFDYEVEVDE